MPEVLVALAVLLVATLGAAGLLQIRQQADFEAYQRRQAVVLLQDMAERINANHQAAACYGVGDTSTGTPEPDTPYASEPRCLAGTRAQQLRAAADLQEWAALVRDAARTNGSGSRLGTLAQARGCIWTDKSGMIRINVAWRGLAATQSPPPGIACARGAIGNEAQRRGMALTLAFGDLGAP